jgi:hypothetical protein
LIDWDIDIGLSVENIMVDFQYVSTAGGSGVKAFPG